MLISACASDPCFFSLTLTLSFFSHTLSQTRFRFRSDDAVFGDDPFRAIVGYSRKVTNASCDENMGESEYCMRCFYRTCEADGSGVFFFEFMWSYFFNAANLDPTP